MQLHGKRVVIIGGSSEIGLETARRALAEGAFVTIAGRSEERLRRASESIAPAGEPLSLICPKSRRSDLCSPGRAGSIMSSCRPGNSGLGAATW
jgi:NAD(P)-dependent dehydrogenase (short-subunit alcohol dehydrogenase family)